MSNDSKLGLVVGVGLIILIAVLFFKRDVANAKVVPETAVAAKPGAVPSPPTPQKKPQQSQVAGYKHVVREGDTLAGLAQHYYHDQTRFADIYQANREVLTSPDQLPPGTVLFIPIQD